jgi:2-polyprenyl-6-methoxyphenol hydroxylase-like FAD-dependent oxidoreductase
MSVRFKPAPGLPTAGIRIARKNLRRTLIDAVNRTDQIRWGMACVSAAKLDDGKMRVWLDGQPTVDCDLLIVADGANSKLRASLRPGDTLQYAGAMQMGGDAVFPQGLPRPLDTNWGLQISEGSGVCCFYSAVDKSSAVWALSIREPHPRPALDKDSPDQHRAILEETLKLGHEFGDRFKTIVGATDPKTVFCIPARDKKPFLHDPALGSVVFIGDSNHAVSPFAGYGASLAMKDGWDLASSLCQSGSVAEAVVAYDAISVSRAAKVLNSSHWRIDMGHSSGLKFLWFKVIITFGGFMLWLLGKS